MYVIFGNSKSIISYGIRVVTWSRWSHCGIVGLDEFGNPVVYESVEFKGVIVTPLTDFIKRYDKIRVGHIDAYVDWGFIYSQLNKKYDYIALVGYLFKANWHNPNRWFCSEFTAKAAIRYSDNKSFFRCDRVQRISPEMVWCVAQTVELEECLSQLESEVHGVKCRMCMPE